MSAKGDATDQDLDSFEGAVNSLSKVQSPTKQQISDAVTAVMNTFYQNGGNPHLGLTTGGPTYHGADAVAKFFTAIFNAFTHFQFRDDSRIYSTNPNIIVVTGAIIGIHSGKWDPGQHSVFNDVNPSNGAVNVPACSIFAFTGNVISTLAIYTDRYQLLHQADPHDYPAPFGRFRRRHGRVVITIEDS